MKEQEQKKTGLPAEQTALKKASDELILAVDAAERVANKLPFHRQRNRRQKRQKNGEQFDSGVQEKIDSLKRLTDNSSRRISVTCKMEDAVIDRAFSRYAKKP